MSALELALVLAVPAALLAIHAVPLRRARPITSAAVWLLVLALRALVTIGLSLLALVELGDVPSSSRRSPGAGTLSCRIFPPGSASPSTGSRMPLWRSPVSWSSFLSCGLA